MQKHETTFIKSHQLCESEAVTELTQTSSTDKYSTNVNNTKRAKTQQGGNKKLDKYKAEVLEN